VRHFWYISKTKLDHLLTQQETIFDRLRASLSGLIKAEIQTPIGSIGVEVKESKIDAKQVRNLEKIEKKLRDANLVKSIEDFGSRRQPLFFEFHGPTARLIQDGQFWVAMLDSQTAVILVGSSAHCIGATNLVSNAISPSIDPLGTIKSLMSHGSTPDEAQLVSNLSYVWASVVRESAAQLGAFSGLPFARGIAISAGAATNCPAHIRESGYEGEIQRIVAGSPIFVEQIAS
jgi:hypothetical protein